MPIDALILIGSGGHAKVVAEIAMLSKRFSSIRILDSDPRRDGERVLGIAVETPLDPGKAPFAFHIAIGDAHARARLWQELLSRGGTPATLVHPDASVSAHAEIGAGSVVAAKAIVAPGARIGCGCIVNHGAVVDHDCTVGDFAHVAPNATLGGGATIGPMSLIGAGAIILPGIGVGARTVVAAGSVVTGSVPDHELWAGVPASRKKAMISVESK